MKILGFYDGHNAAAALIEDGKVIFAIEEERLSRIKFHDGRKFEHGLPYRCIGETLRNTGTKPEEIDMIALGFESTKDSLHRTLHDYQKIERNRMIPFTLGWPIPIVYQEYRLFNVLRVLRKYNLHNTKLVRINHHIAHAASAYYNGNKKNATVITLDGKGDGLAGLVMVVENGEFKILSEISFYDSPGHFYSTVTEGLGFRHNRHEGKITGLAAYGHWDNEAYKAFKNILNTENLNFEYSLSRKIPQLPYPLIAPFKKYWQVMKSEINNFSELSREHIASAAQKRLEDSVTSFVRTCVDKSGFPDVVTAGGVFANVKLNQKVTEMEEVDSFFVYPAMGDGGIAVGAALYCYGMEMLSKGNIFQPCEIDPPYYGPKYSSEEIEQSLKNHRLKYRYVEDIELEVAHMIRDKKVVGRFDGRLEYGPRALGNRSILVTPVDNSINDSLNKRMKRTEFMPFAPVTLEEEASATYINYAKGSYPARFMTITFDVEKEIRKKIPAVVHIDNTARPQTINKKQNRSYYETLKIFKDITGLNSFINTSFNMHEEPIVCTPDDAIKSFKTKCVDVLAIGNYIVENI
ncbi:MAG: hypothetical protein OIN87_02090 [Candidatus Methanoperedens sp.]|nr:hypothetical protein [Candidatus Methanoperedens sp.]